MPTEIKIDWNSKVRVQLTERGITERRKMHAAYPDTVPPPPEDGVVEEALGSMYMLGSHEFEMPLTLIVDGDGEQAPCQSVEDNLDDELPVRQCDIGDGEGCESCQ